MLYTDKRAKDFHAQLRKNLSNATYITLRSTKHTILDTTKRRLVS